MSTPTLISNRLFVSALAQEPDVLEPEMFLDPEKPVTANLERMPEQGGAPDLSHGQSPPLPSKDWC